VANQDVGVSLLMVGIVVRVGSSCSSSMGDAVDDEQDLSCDITSGSSQAKVKKKTRDFYFQRRYSYYLTAAVVIALARLHATRSIYTGETTRDMVFEGQYLQFRMICIVLMLIIMTSVEQ